MSEYRIVERTPTAQEFNATRAGAGLLPKNPVAAERGLKGSLYCICVEHQGHVVGIGRVVGDGGLWFDIVDVAVLKAHQGKGLGRQIMDALMTYVRDHALPTSFIALMTQQKMIPFYERYGFKVRGPSGPGMFQIVPGA